MSLAGAGAFWRAGREGAGGGPEAAGKQGPAGAGAWELSSKEERGTVGWGWGQW